MAGFSSWAQAWLLEQVGGVAQPRTGHDGRAGWSAPWQPIGSSRGEHAAQMHQVSHWREGLPAGIVLFQTQFTPRGGELVVLEADSPLKALRFMGTNADNYGRGTEDLIKTLERWPAEFAFELDLLYVTFDSVAFELLSYPPDERAFARAAAAFCPDLVTQDFGSVRQLEEYLDLMVLEYLWLWWD